VYAKDEEDTILKLFRKCVANDPEADWIGTRDFNQEGGPYVWG